VGSPGRPSRSTFELRFPDGEVWAGVLLIRRGKPAGAVVNRLPSRLGFKRELEQIAVRATSGVRQGSIEMTGAGELVDVGYLLDVGADPLRERLGELEQERCGEFGLLLAELLEPVGGDAQ